MRANPRQTKDPEPMWFRVDCVQVSRGVRWRRWGRAAGPGTTEVSPRPAAAGGPAAASPPAGSPPQYSPALRRVTTGFGMGPGGATALAATGTSDSLTSHVLACIKE